MGLHGLDQLRDILISLSVFLYVGESDVIFLNLNLILRVATPVLLPGKIPWMEEPGRLQSKGSLRVGHD